MKQKKHISVKAAAALVNEIRGEYGLPPYKVFRIGHRFFKGMSRIKRKQRAFFLLDEVIAHAHELAKNSRVRKSSTPPAEEVQPELPLAPSSPAVVKNAFRDEWNYAETLARYLRDVFYAVKYDRYDHASQILTHAHILGLLDDSTYDNLSNLLKK